MELTPLVRSAEYDAIESELKALFLSLYKAGVDSEVVEVNTYGMPHLGPDKFISRGLNDDGLALLSDTPNDSTRLLFTGWRYLNPQRGTPFLRLYLRSLFGDVFTIEQLWCSKTGTYPVDVLSEREVAQAGHDLKNYFLTSRLRVDIETEIVPLRILQAARTAVAARFVLEIRAARRTLSTYGIGIIASSVLVCRTHGDTIYMQPEVRAGEATGVANIMGGSNFVYSFSGGHDTQSHLN